MPRSDEPKQPAPNRRTLGQRPAWKALIEEEFGCGIMSAIDFDMTMERLPDPKGDRVKIGMTGKFLPFKYYGATGNAQQYGYKEA
jgi:cyanate lyase